MMVGVLYKENKIHKRLNSEQLWACEAHEAMKYTCGVVWELELEALCIGFLGEAWAIATVEGLLRCFTLTFEDAWGVSVFEKRLWWKYFFLGLSLDHEIFFLIFLIDLSHNFLLGGNLSLKGLKNSNFIDIKNIFNPF